MGENLLVVGVFKEAMQAESAISDLRDAGFDKDQIEYSGDGSHLEINHALDNLVRMGLPENEAIFYKSELDAGCKIVVVRHLGRRSETLAILLLNDAKHHQYLKKNESEYIEPFITSTAKGIGGLPDQQQDSQDSPVNNSSRATTRNENKLLTEDELASVRNLLEREGLDHLL